MKRWLLAIAFLVLLLEVVVSPLIVLTAQNQARKFAIINDIAVRQSEDVGFRLVAVDGSPVQRWSSHFVTVVPYALVPAGRHKLMLESVEGDATESLEIDVVVEKGKRYRFGVVDDRITVVPD